MSREATDLGIPSVTTEQMREVDRLMVERYGIQIVQMMENAGRALAALGRSQLGGSVLGRNILVACGWGNNGGGGMVAARHLYNWGANVTIILRNEELSGTPALQWDILKLFPLEKKIGEAAKGLLKKYRGDLIIDALVGYGLKGAPAGWTKDVIEIINAHKIPVISLDVPSGLDATTGEVHKPCIHAAATLTLALPKTGLLNPDSKRVVGSLYLADISVPQMLYMEMGIDAGPIFVQDDIIRIDNSEGGSTYE